MMGAKIVTLANVHSKLLGNSREVYVYLPPSYAESKNRRYPVLYAQDGQHMFASDAKGDSWEMHQTAERLSREGRMEEVIIVAVSSISDQRGSEYFHNHPGVREAFHTTCKGELYELFTTACTDGTNQQEPLIEQKVYHSFPVKPPSLRVWVDIGGAEGLIMPRHVRAFVDEMIESGFTPGEDLMFLLDETAGHSQADWARRLHRPLMYLFGEIGRPCSLRLAGRRQVGLEGYRVRLYPKVTYDTGFEMSLLTAEYKVDCPEVLTVGSNGLIVPLASGKADVAVQFGGLTGTANIEVIPELSDHVQVEISVTVPPSTPADAQIHAGFEIPKVRDGFYQGSFLLPRDLAFDVKVSRGFGCHERRKTSRRFDTSEPVRLHFNVEEWEDDSTS
ncbi:alpha/beta hydrolase-fold protein [Paenibacillus sp. p3-SID1389]|uniref:alpha/beta hydrolase-fold protein n=1 Tax=Paenibacillus sp. p3-SID1389 TaxID=2916364 RepID=UPI0021A91E25|nr:alpha/beta hydrolase-fold protein [Paenibacillus sp. p3-SID1389]MCT2196339.1 alpha/beta hydrolase-fold protein [Paenibacillus sp. p3-SID1389]